MKLPRGQMDKACKDVRRLLLEYLSKACMAAELFAHNTHAHTLTHTLTHKKATLVYIELH